MSTFEAEFGEFLTTPAVVSTYEGDGAYGPTYASPVLVNTYCEHMLQLVTGGDGQEVTASTMLKAAPQYEALFAAESRVVVRSRTLKVITTEIVPVDDALGMQEHVTVWLA